MNSDEMMRYYCARAPEYEQAYYRDVPKRREELREEAERLERLVAGKTVLDLACGTGFWTGVMAKTAAGITAVDVSSEMIREAKKKQYALPVQFIQADLYNMPTQPRNYDIVALGFWFSHHPRQEYDRLFGVLTAGLGSNGLIWMIDNNPPAEFHPDESVRTDENGNNFKRRCLNDGREFVILKNYFSRPELESIFSARFKIRKLVYRRYYWSAVLSGKRDRA